MKKAIIYLALLLVFPAMANALSVAGVQLEQSVAVNNKVLQLNGHGIRKKFFVKVYIGSLYAAKKLTGAAEILSDNGDKLIRMNFLHSKVEKHKITEAFAEGFSNNAPDVASSAEGKKFLSLFTNDFVKGDVVDLILAEDGTVEAKHNAKSLGSIKSAKLAKGILLIYFGDKPADEDLKKGMSGK